MGSFERCHPKMLQKSRRVLVTTVGSTPEHVGPGTYEVGTSNQRRLYETPWRIKGVPLGVLIERSKDSIILTLSRGKMKTLHQSSMQWFDSAIEFQPMFQPHHLHPILKDSKLKKQIIQRLVVMIPVMEYLTKT